MITGMIINNVFVPDTLLDYENGTRVRLVFDDPLELTEEESLHRLRKSYEDAKAGNGRPFDEVMSELSEKYGLPPYIGE